MIPLLPLVLNITVDSPQSVLTGRYDISPSISKSFSKVYSSSTESVRILPILNPKAVSYPTAHHGDLKSSVAIRQSKKIKPMLATALDKPFNNKDWVFEVNGMG